MRARSLALLGVLVAALAVATGDTAPVRATGVVVSRENPFERALTRARVRRGSPAVQQVIIDAARSLGSFVPDHALGGALDGHERGETAQIYTPANERAMAAAGLGPIAYRLRTELGVAAWHWNATGTWSDPANHRGYWSSSAVPGRPSRFSNGYALPRRGDTVDQADNEGFSRLDDGSLGTFWKSNPYLDPFYTHERSAAPGANGRPARRGAGGHVESAVDGAGGQVDAHPQWVLVDFSYHRPVDAVRIAWGTPYATRFRVQWWQGPEALYQAGHAPGRWREFPRSAFAGHGGVQTLSLAVRPLSARFVRVLMTAGSHTAPHGSRDVRDRLGYAIRELSVGRLEHGRFVDLVHHSQTNQTFTAASSTDPWHTAADLARNYEQPGLTTVLRSGLTRGLPLLVPVPVLYGTPQDAVAELRYLRALHVPIGGVELGEEPDGQYASPEDYGALYVQFAHAIHRYDPTLRLGGPGYQTSIPDWYAWPDAHGERSWTRRFVSYLTGHGALGELGFFSFEWYPFDNGCRPVGPQLARASGMLAAVMHRQTLEGLPPAIPRVITEYGYSAFAAQHEVELSGAVLNVDIAADFLALGGDSSYLYGYEPSELLRELKCASWGNLTLLQANSEHRVRAPVASYWGTRLLTHSWVQPGAQANTMLATSATGGAPVAAYALRRPDGGLSVLLLNKDPHRARPVSIELHGAGPDRPLTGPLTVEQLSQARYAWHAAGPRGYARVDLPPARTMVIAAAGTTLTLPPLSITVIRTRGP